VLCFYQGVECLINRNIPSYLRKWVTPLIANVTQFKEIDHVCVYYSIVTSEKHLTDKEIRDIYRGLWEIEESFKVIKSEFKARPVYLRLENHIKAHFLICFVSLLIMRVLEYLMEKEYSIKQIRNSLIQYSCSHLDQNYYLFDYRDDVLKTAEKIFDLNLGNKIMATREIKKFCSTKKK